MAAFPQQAGGTNPHDQAAQPPGLWQAPGLAGGVDASGDAPSIEAQVQRLIDEARHDTEVQVKMELKGIRDKMLAIDAKLDMLLAELDGLEREPPAKAPLDAEAVAQLLSRTEQVWGQEIRTLKQELHQTILAHNHNADLIKHHKDTIDALRERCVKLQAGGGKTTEMNAQLQRLDQRLKQQQKQRKLEPLFERLAILEQRVATASQNAWHAAYPGMPQLGVPPSLNLHPGVNPALLPPGVPFMGSAANAASALAGARGGTTSASTKASYRCPTDEEVQARLSAAGSKLTPPPGVAAPGAVAVPVPTAGEAAPQASVATPPSLHSPPPPPGMPPPPAPATAAAAAAAALAGSEDAGGQ